LTIGLTASGKPINAVELRASAKQARTVLLIGGLNGTNDDSVLRVVAETAKFDEKKPSRRAFNLIAVGLANPDGVPLKFPPTGVAYRENAEAHVLWRWIGLHAPDLVIVAGEQDYGLAEALSANVVAETGRIPTRRVLPGQALLDVNARSLKPSQARIEMDRRAARTPRQLADELAQVYGHEFNQPLYIQALALIARTRLGEIEDVKRLVAPYVDGEKDSLTRPNSLVLAGHLVFAELARRTGDQRYVQMVRKAADLGFEADGRMKESMPYHDGYSDSVFMGTVIAAEAGALTGDRKYFDLAARHVAFMQKLVLRPDGLYRHSPATDAAWGRGNGFPAIGLALSLPLFPKDHPELPRLVQSFQAHMQTHAAYQDRDGLWRNVVDYPGAYAEVSGTAMIGFSMLQGIRHGWLPREKFQPVVDKAWQAVLARTGPQGHMVDVCESTFNLKSIDDYVRRAALFGVDARAGAMALMFATAMAGLD
jgi:unsaturated rhamnogalacturonyl hydrolase